MTVTISERPVLRDPKSGLLDRHPAYEGWAPREPASRSSWWLVIAGLGLVVVARAWGL